MNDQNPADGKSVETQIPLQMTDQFEQYCERTGTSEAEALRRLVRAGLKVEHRNRFLSTTTYAIRFITAILLASAILLSNPQIVLIALVTFSFDLLLNVVNYRVSGYHL